MASSIRRHDPSGATKRSGLRRHAVYGALHALDGLLIVGIAGYLYARAWRQRN
jgi:hypothetical protein